jgi:hypothetical protein
MDRLEFNIKTLFPNHPLIQFLRNDIMNKKINKIIKNLVFNTNLNKKTKIIK